MVRSGIYESEVVDTWRRAMANGAELATESGETIKVVYPGRMSPNGGADFQDAVIATGGGLVKGDIEVHIRASQWKGHQHHRNHAYERVALHVVMWNDTGEPTSFINEKSIPVVSLQKLGNAPRGQDAAAMPCADSPARFSPEYIARTLDNAGDERFCSKVNAIGEGIAQMGGCPALYSGIMVALGYSENKLPFLELARRVSVNVLESLGMDSPEEEYLARVQSLLLGAAGLLPSQRPMAGQRHPDRWTRRLERLWMQNKNRQEPMPSRSWRLFRVRPANFPVRRIAAMSHLLLRYRTDCLLEGLTGALRAAPEGGWRELQAALEVPPAGYWAQHFDFGSGLRSTPLVGVARAAEIAVNVLLPFFCAYLNDGELKSRAFNIYQSYPRLAPNGLETHMKHQLGIPGRTVNSARRQQGLLHIYKTLCTQGGCERCALG